MWQDAADHDGVMRCEGAALLTVVTGAYAAADQCTVAKTSTTISWPMIINTNFLQLSHPETPKGSIVYMVYFYLYLYLFNANNGHYYYVTFEELIKEFVLNLKLYWRDNVYQDIE